MAFWTLYKRELSSYFHSAVAYVVLFGSALIQSLFFIFLVQAVMENNYKDQSVMQIYFQWPLFWLLLIGQVPLITMRVFSEEFKLGTIEMLLTAPVREWDVVLAKFAGALSFFVVLWLPAALDFFLLQVFSSPQPTVYWIQIGLTVLTLLLGGGFYVSLGVLMSVLTRNQIIAAVLTFAALLFFFTISLWRWTQHTDGTSLEFLSYISLAEHLQNAVLGIFDTRPIAYYLSATALTLMITKTILEGRRLRS